MVEIDRTGVTQPGEYSEQRFLHIADTFFPGYVQMLEGEGMPLFEQFGHGNLYIEYSVVLPVELSSDMRRSKAQYCLLEGSVTHSSQQQNSAKFSTGLETTREMSYKTLDYIDEVY